MLACGKKRKKKSFPIKRLNLLVVTFHGVTEQQEDDDGLRKCDWFMKELDGAR